METLREQILNADDIEMTPIHVDKWNVDVYTKGMTVGQLQKFSKGMKELDESGSIDKLLQAVIDCTVDENGAPIFTKADASILKTKNFTPIRQIGEKVLELTTEDNSEKIKKN